MRKPDSAPDAGQPSPEQFWHDRLWQPTPGTAQIVADLMTDYAATVSEHHRKAQAAKRLTITLDDNCLDTIKRLSVDGGEEISFGGVMGGVKLKWQQLAAPSAPASAAREFYNSNTSKGWLKGNKPPDETWHGYYMRFAEQFAAEQTRQLREELATARELSEYRLLGETEYRQRAQAAEAERDKLLEFAQHKADCHALWIPDEDQGISFECTCGLERLRKEKT